MRKNAYRYPQAIAVVVGCFVTPMAWSQCAPGIPSAGNPACVPPDQSNSPYYQGDGAQPQAPTQPNAVWADRWGAIAVDGDTGQVGVIANISGMNEAMDLALKQCTKTGSHNCKVELTYHNQCAALAWGQSNHSVSGAPYLDIAKSHAMKNCSERTTECKVVYSECSYAIRVQ